MNIGNPREMTLEEMARAIIEMTGSTSRIVYKPLPVDDPKVRQPDITRARTLLGWEPKVPVEEGLETTIDVLQEEGCRAAASARLRASTLASRGTMAGSNSSGSAANPRQRRRWQRQPALQERSNSPQTRSSWPPNASRSASTTGSSVSRRPYGSCCRAIISATVSSRLTSPSRSRAAEGVRRDGPKILVTQPVSARRGLQHARRDAQTAELRQSGRNLEFPVSLHLQPTDQESHERRDALGSEPDIRPGHSKKRREQARNLEQRSGRGDFVQALVARAAAPAGGR